MKYVTGPVGSTIFQQEDKELLTAGLSRQADFR